MGVTIKEKGDSREHTDCLMVVDRHGKVKKDGPAPINGCCKINSSYQIWACLGKPKDISGRIFPFCGSLSLCVMIPSDTPR